MDRRDFLRNTAAMGAGLVLGTKVLGETAAKAAAKGDAINVALIGVGKQGQVLLDACLKIPNIRFKAVCDIWESYNLKKVSGQLRAYKHEHNTYIDYAEMLAKEKDLDAAIVATPDFKHAEHTIACLKAGLNVYCEKEMSNTLESARKMVQTAKETGKLLQIGHQRRSNPKYIHCYEKLIKEAHLFGRMTTINGQWNRSVVPDFTIPEKYDIPQDVLSKNGFESMPQFLNWRWYKGLGGGPIVDLGSHQIDIYNWFLDACPKSVIASGGTDYYDKKTHQWYDTVMAIYEYQTKEGMVRAYYQTITTNSNNGYFETFMGDEGTLLISEASGRSGVYRESRILPAKWEKWIKAGYIEAPKEEKAEAKPGDSLADVRETMAPPSYILPVELKTKYHQPHLQNFFDAIRGKAKLNCPGEDAYKTAVTVLKVNEAVEKASRLEFNEQEFKV